MATRKETCHYCAESLPRSMMHRALLNPAAWVCNSRRKCDERTERRRRAAMRRR
jgi:hypothetical protein